MGLAARWCRFGALICIAAALSVAPETATAADLPADPWQCDDIDHSCLEFSGWAGDAAWGFVADGPNDQNCTAYAAWRLQQAGVDRPEGWFVAGDMNAERWDDHAVGVDEIRITSAPAAGMVGIWNGASRNHVAFIDKVVYDGDGRWSEIWISESNYPGTASREILRPSDSWKPDVFLDFGATAQAGNGDGKDDVLQAAGSGVGWRVKWGASGSWKTLSSSSTTSGLLVGNFNAA